MRASSSSQHRPVPRGRTIGFRLAAVLLGCLPLGLLELACRALGWGQPAEVYDPFLGFNAARPLFVASADGLRQEIAPARLTHFRPESFAARKRPDEFRVFCLGGSTVQGRPYSIETSFTKWLEISLQAAEPQRHFKVVNCGGVSYASYRLLPILKEVLNYQPDLIIFYEGHNEFLEDRTFARVKYAPRWLTWAQDQVAELRVYQLLRRGLLRTAIVRPEAPASSFLGLGPEVDARLDWKNGMEAYHRDPVWQRDCTAQFEFNLHQIVASAREAHVPLMLVNPAVNLDWPPFKAEPSAQLNDEQRAQVEQLWSAARTHYRDDPAQALALLKQAVAVDREHAGLRYDLGKCYQGLGIVAQARDELLQAKDLDVCPLRILSPMQAIVQRVATATETPLVDADKLFAARSPDGIGGSQWFVDHVHPTIAGHQLLADQLADALVQQRLVRPQAEWPANRLDAYQRHLDRLPATYFPDAAKRLRAEQGWAHGTADKQRRP